MGLLGVEQIKELRANHLAQHGFGNRVRLGIVIDINIQAIHDVVVRVREQLFHRGIAHLWRDAFGGESAEVTLGSQGLHIVQRQGRSFWRTGGGVSLKHGILHGLACRLARHDLLSLWGTQRASITCA